MSAIRRAALRLRGLDDRDRAWVLSRLDPEERARIEPLLDELAGLAAPDAADAPEPTGPERAEDPGGAKQAAPELPDPRSEAERALAAVDAQRLASILRDEPACVVAALLASEAWSWRGRFLDALAPSRRRELLARANACEGKLPPALRRAVLEAAARRVSEARPDEAAPSGFDAVLAKEQARRRRLRWLERSPRWVR